MPVFINKPAFVEANLFDNRLTPPEGVLTDEHGQNYIVTTQGARVLVSLGDWIVREPDGIHHYVCRSGMFHRRWEITPNHFFSRDASGRDCKIQWHMNAWYQFCWNGEWKPFRRLKDGEYEVFKKDMK